MGTAPREDLAALDRSGSEFTVEQTGQDKNFRPEYEARAVTGDTIFRCTYQMYEAKDEFPFVDADGTELFTVKAVDTVDIAGDYRLTDSATGDPLVILDNDFSLRQDTWRIRDAADETVLAEITSRGGLFTAARKLLPVGQFIGHRFEVTDADGDAIGTIESDFAIHDQYEVSLRDSSSVPTEAILAATVVIDGIQGN